MSTATFQVPEIPADVRLSPLEGPIVSLDQLWVTIFLEENNGQDWDELRAILRFGCKARRQGFTISGTKFLEILRRVLPDTANHLSLVFMSPRASLTALIGLGVER